jgi:putative tryptophan/tyrosine transport system substrate-binding protein
MYLYIGGLVAKKLELLHEMAPDADRFALLVNPGTPSAKLDSSEIKTAGAGPPVSVINASTDAEIDAIFADLAARKTAAIIGTDTVYFAHRAHLSTWRRRSTYP